MTGPFNSRYRIKSERAAAIAVTLVPLIYFSPAVLTGRVLCPADGILQNVPFRATAAQMIRSGYLPLWNPYIFSGTPFMASAQVGLLFPLNWFYVIFSSPAATNLMVISAYMAAALGAYLFARRSGASVTGAVVTSLIWQWSGHLVGQIAHINIVHTAALAPWVFWSIEYYVANGSSRRGLLIAALVAIQLFAGHHQTFVYSLLLTAAYTLFLALRNAESRKRYFGALAYLGSGIFLAAVQILPTFELLRNSNRATASYDFFTSFSLPRSFVGLFVAPYIRGGGDGRLFRAPYIGPPFYPELVGYVGLLGLMLAITAFVIRRDTRTKFWIIVAPVALLLAFGRHVPFGLYKFIYFVPVLNLFRVPARHLLEVDFALAVLAGRGVTALAELRRRPGIHLRVALVGAAIFLLTVLAVTALRPSAFRLGREAPVSFLRAPELFLPVLIAALSAIALWLIARRHRRATLVLISVLAFDLVVWGQSSTWYTDSPKRDDEYWYQPASVHALKAIGPQDVWSFRILTAPHPFDPAQPPVGPSVSHSGDWVLWTEPDVYMPHGFHNAAGYDGFSLQRYSDLAGQMKVWGELTDPDRALRGLSREIDLTNTRYLVAMRKQSPTKAGSPSDRFAQATEQHGDFRFAPTDLSLPAIGKDKRIVFTIPPIEVDRVALLTSLAWSENVANDAVVARLRLTTVDGQSLDLPLKAGADTAEWAHDRPDIHARIRHRRATVATSYGVEDATGHYQAHTYLAALLLPQTTKVTGGEIVLEPAPAAPDLTLSVFRISAENSATGETFALRRDAIAVDRADSGTATLAAVPSNERWKLATQTQYVQIYENTRALPRAWLASEVRALDEKSMLEVIRSGSFSDGTPWDPARTALVEAELPTKPDPKANGTASISRYEPNRVDLQTSSDGASILILSENHYPGWRAYVDGRLVETLRVDYNLRGVVVPAGEHRVEFVYWPKSVLLGLLTSVLTVLGLFTWPRIRRVVPSRIPRKDR